MSRQPQYLSKKFRNDQKQKVKIKCAYTDRKEMLFVVKEIDNLKEITNAILSSGCYGDIEKEKQIERANSRGELTTEEHKAISEIWEFRKSRVKKLLKKWEQYKKDYMTEAKNGEKK